jgi:hypothetical protein
MKTLLIATLAVTISGIGYAQSSFEQKFDIPFAFHIGKQLLPAGRYVVQSTHNNSIIMLTSKAHGSGGGFLLGSRLDQSRKAPELPSLVFNSYGDRGYFVSQMWAGNKDGGFEALKSRTEKEVVKSTITASEKATQVRILAAK